MSAVSGRVSDDITHDTSRSLSFSEVGPRVVFWDPQTTNTSARVRGGHPREAALAAEQVPDTALAVLDRDQGATAYLVGLKDRHGVGFDAANQSGR